MTSLEILTLSAGMRETLGPLIKADLFVAARAALHYGLKCMAVADPAVRNAVRAAARNRLESLCTDTELVEKALVDEADPMHMTWVLLACDEAVLDHLKRLKNGGHAPGCAGGLLLQMIQGRPPKADDEDEEDEGNDALGG